MNDAELVAEFIRVEQDSTETRMLVQEIHWEGPAKPVATWTIAARLSPDADRAHLDAEAQRLLHDSRFFGVCSECGERNPQGWMHGPDLCQRCAVRNHGIVF